MGNIDCRCIKEINTPEILTPKNTNKLRVANTYDGYYSNTTSQGYDYNRDDTIIKSRADKNKNGNEPEITPNDNQQADIVQEKVIEKSQAPPILKENFMDYSMDLFDEYNKFRANHELFNELKKKYPNISINNNTNKTNGFEVGWNQRLYDMLEEFLDINKDCPVNNEFKQLIMKSFKINVVNIYEIQVKELNFEKNICEFLDKYYTKYTNIFTDSYSIGTIGTMKKDEIYRIILLLA